MAGIPFPVEFSPGHEKTEFEKELIEAWYRQQRWEQHEKVEQVRIEQQRIDGLKRAAITKEEERTSERGHAKRKANEMMRYLKNN